MHKYENVIADEFLEALAETECIDIFSNKSIQALIEIKWPLVKTAIKKWLFYPYLVFLLTFLYYTVYIFERVQEVDQESDALQTLTTTQTSLYGNATFINGFNSSDGLMTLQDSSNADKKPTLLDLKDLEFWLSREKFIVKVLV